MSNDIIQTIKNLAHKISEDYLFTKKDMNDALVESYLNGDIENEEVLKRICEHANQNVYLSLFNDPTVNKANITFDIVDFNKILPIIRESETAMSDLNITPTDYKSTTGVSAAPKMPGPQYENQENEGEQDEQTAEMQSNVEKSASLEAVVAYRDNLKNFIDKIACFKSQEEKQAEIAFDKMAEDTKLLIAKDDSIGDIAKLATRYAKDLGADNFVKVAQAYDMIHKNLVDGNYHVKTEFTKISSMKINPNAEMLKPVHNFVMSTSKISGFEEMHKNASLLLDRFNSYISQELKK